MRASGLPTLADDSGIEVDALGGGPGVRTRRYAGEDATDEQNNAKLLGALAGLPPDRRGARYVCVLALALPEVAGRARRRAGHHGPWHVSRAHRGGAPGDWRLRLRPDLRARVRAARWPDPRPVDAGREERHLAPRSRRPPDGPEAGGTRVLTHGCSPTRAYGDGVAFGALVAFGFGVGHGTGSTPGSPNSAAAIARILTRFGACESPNCVLFDFTSGARMTTLVTSSLPTSSRIAARSGSRSTGRSVRIVWPTASSRSGSWKSRLPPRVTSARSATRICC